MRAHHRRVQNYSFNESFFFLLGNFGSQRKKMFSFTFQNHFVFLCQPEKNKPPGSFSYKNCYPRAIIGVNDVIDVKWRHKCDIYATLLCHWLIINSLMMRSKRDNNSLDPMIPTTETHHWCNTIETTMHLLCINYGSEMHLLCINYESVTHPLCISYA